MDGEIELISDGDGLAVIGDPKAVERFLTSEGLESRDLGLPRLRGVVGTGAAAAQAGSEIAANAGRWVKLTEESAQETQEVQAHEGVEFEQFPRGVDGSREEQRIPRDSEDTRLPLNQPEHPGRRWRNHGAGCHAAGDGRDHRLPRHDRCQA